MSKTEDGQENQVAIREILSRIGDKWSVQIVASLRQGPLRFTELKRTNTGISQRMLTLCLKNLERDGILTRTTFATSPPRVDYELSPLGQTLLEPVVGLTTWAERHWPEVEAARRRYDEANVRE